MINSSCIAGSGLQVLRTAAPALALLPAAFAKRSGSLSNGYVAPKRIAGSRGKAFRCVLRWFRCRQMCAWT